MLVTLMPFKLMPMPEIVPAAPKKTMSLVVGRRVLLVQLSGVSHAVPAPLPAPAPLPLQP